MDLQPVRQQARDWLVRITSGDMSPNEADSFKRWCAQSQQHASTFAEVSRAWRLLGVAAQPEDGLDLPLLHQTRPPSHLSRRNFLAAAGVVGITLLAPAGLRTSILGDANDSIQTGRGEQQHLNISDGIAITLNTLTHMEVLNNKATLGQHRFKLITGEVDIQCTSPFKAINILAANGEISGSEAHISIRNLNDIVQVTCMKGYSDIHYQGQHARIKAGEQIQYSQSSMTLPKQVNASNINSWLNRILVFNDAPLSFVIDEVNRYRSGKILLINPKIAKRRVQARFKLDRLDEVISLMTNVYGLNSFSLPGGVVLLT